MAIETKRRPLVYRFFVGPWSGTELGLKKMSVISLILESLRWAMQGRFPDLQNPTAPGVSEWARLFYVAQLAFFCAASSAAGSHVIDAVKNRSPKNVNIIGMVLYLAWWIEVLLAGGYLTHLG